ncbi:MAG: AAA family ATPase [Chromatiales bacterium]|nr:AAA family ATPase [Gammaproteobacteria bacterium]
MTEQVAQLDSGYDPNKDPSNPIFEPTRRSIQALIDNGEIAGRRLAREASVNETAFNHFLNQKLGTGTRFDRVVDRLNTWLETRERRIAAQAEYPDSPTFCMTQTSNKIMEVLMYAHHAPDMAVIHGAAGAGKTETAREYVRNNAGVCLATISNATSTVHQSLREIGKCLGIKNAASKAALFDTICDELAQTRGLLIIDEAHELSPVSVDQIRHIHDRAGVGVVLMGNDQVYSNMTGGRSAAYLDRVYSRVGMWHSIKKSSSADIEQLLDVWNISDAASRKELRQVAAKPGALRLMGKIIRLARMLAGDAVMEVKHIRAARRRSGKAAA